MRRTGTWRVEELLLVIVLACLACPERSRRELVEGFSKAGGGQGDGRAALNTEHRTLQRPPGYEGQAPSADVRAKEGRSAGGDRDRNRARSRKGGRLE